MKIIVAGTIFVDIKGHPYNKYIPDGRNEGFIEYVHGGVGRNIAEDLANLGSDVTFLSTADDSGVSFEVISHLKEVNVDTSGIVITKNGLGTWLAVFDDTGDVISSISGRPDLSCLKNHIEENHESIFSDADAVILEADISKDVVDTIYKYASLHSTPVFAGIATMSCALDNKDVIENAYCFICNQQEAGMLFDTDTENLSPEAMLDMLLENTDRIRNQIIIITMGEQGSVYLSKDGDKGCISPVKADLKDSTGAGDSYLAGFTASIINGCSIKEACEHAAAIASCVIASADNVYTGGSLGTIIKKS